MRLKKTEAIGLLILFAISAVLFGSLLDAPKLNWDDDSNIFGNPYFKAGMWKPFWTEPYFGLYVPVTSMVWGALYWLGEGAVWPFRLLNLLLHSFNIALVFFLARALARRWSLNEWGALLAAAIFALHPLQVHPVGWISGGRDLLSTFFSLAALGIYFLRPGSLLVFLGATFLYVCAILAKPSAVVLPAALLALEFVLNAKPQRLVWLKMAVWTLLSLSVIHITRSAQVDFLKQEITSWERLLVIFDTYSFYLMKFLLPYELSVNYAHTPGAALADPDIYWSAGLGFGALIGLLFLAWRRDRRYGLILVWLFLLAPVSGVVPFGFQKISTVSDHYMYLPIAVLAVLIMFIVSKIRVKRVMPAVLMVTVPVLTVLSAARADVWRSDANLFEDMVRTAPDSYATAMGMSVLRCRDQKNYDDGVLWTEKALKERPKDIMALANQAYCFLHSGNYFRVIELEGYLSEMDLDEMEAKQPTAYSSLLASIGTAYIEQQDYDDGFQFLCEAYRIMPSEPNHRRNLEIATKILRDKNLNPDCETPAPDGTEDLGDDAPPAEPAEEVWPGQPAEEEGSDAKDTQ